MEHGSRDNDDDELTGFLDIRYNIELLVVCDDVQERLKMFAFKAHYTPKRSSTDSLGKSNYTCLHDCQFHSSNT